MTNNSNNFKMTVPSADDSEAICHVMIQSITKICAVDYNDDPKIIGEWLANKTPENVALWINNKANKSCAAFDVNKKECIGFALMNSSGEILLNYVLPGHTNKGIGKALLSKIEEIAKNLDLNKLSVVSTITAKSFYEKNGFIKNGEPEYVGHILGDFPLIKCLNPTIAD